MKTDPQLPTTKTTAARRTVPMTTEMPSRTPTTAQIFTFSPSRGTATPQKSYRNAPMPHMSTIKFNLKTNFVLDQRERKPHYK